MKLGTSKLKIPQRGAFCRFGRPVFMVVVAVGVFTHRRFPERTQEQPRAHHRSRVVFHESYIHFFRPLHESYSNATRLAVCVCALSCSCEQRRRTSPWKQTSASCITPSSNVRSRDSAFPKDRKRQCSCCTSKKREKKKVSFSRKEIKKLAPRVPQSFRRGIQQDGFRGVRDVFFQVCGRL